MFRRYNRWHSRFDQPDPYDGSYDFSDPQSLNRYAYVQNDPVNFVDPTGLELCFGLFEVTTIHVGGQPVEVPTRFIRYTYCVLAEDNYRPPSPVGVAPAPGRDVGGPGLQQGPATQPQERNDCLEFANIVAQLGEEWRKKYGSRWIYSASEFKDALIERFNRGRYGSGATEEFGDRGFKLLFQDGSNQVRHYVFAFRMGFSGGDIGDAIADGREIYTAARDKEPVNIHDLALNKVAARHAYRVNYGLTKPQKLADLIRKDLCR